MNIKLHMSSLRRAPKLFFFLVIAMSWAFPPVSQDYTLMAAKKKIRKAHAPAGKKILAGTREISIGGVTTVKIPLNLRLAKSDLRTFTGDDFVLNVYAREFAQGNAGYLEFLPHPGESLPRRLRVRASFEGADIIIGPRAWGMSGIFPIPPDITPGLATLEVSAQGGRADRVYRFPLKIAPSRFETYRKRMNLGSYSDKDLFTRRPDLKERYERETKRKKELFAKEGPGVIAGWLSHPRDYHRVTSTFYAKRIYDRYHTEKGKKIRTKPKVSYHQGLDLMGQVGSPVYAIADGVVAIAEDMFYEGNHTVIDHGKGIYSRYMHQSEMLVRVGQKVKAGELIGKVGDTGMVTGPHLHMGLLIRGVYVDPVSLLCLPVRGD